MSIRRGDVCWALLKPRSGSEQSGRRPVVIVSHDIFNAAAGWRSVIVLPCSTSHTQRQRSATAVYVPKRTGGLPTESVVLCHQVTTLDRSKIGARLGRLPEDYLREIERGLMAALQIGAFAD